MENAQDESKLTFGLIGKNIDYSFSRGYFANKFESENLPHQYVNFDMDDISGFPNIFDVKTKIKGLNVTIPYKEQIIPYLHKLDKRAKKIGAVNTIKISKKGKLTGYNTDYYGFKKSIEPYIKQHHKRALILGTGGASKAVVFALKKLSIKSAYVSRSAGKNIKFTYEELTEKIIEKYSIIINCTPVGTYPNVNDCPEIPYNGITDNHILYDLIYNPEETKFLRVGKQQNATTINGKKMLQLQADKAWEIWNK